MSQPLIRRAGSADAEALATIGAATFVETFGHLYPAADLEAFLLHAYGLDRIRSDLADPAKASWIVEAGGQAVGYALAGPCGLPHPLARPDDGEVNRLYLLKAWQNGGTGGACSTRSRPGFRRMVRAPSGSASGPAITRPSVSTPGAGLAVWATTNSPSGTPSTTSTSLGGAGEFF